MASIDHSDAYFSVPVDPSHKNTLDFYGKGDYISSLVLQKDSHVLPRVLTNLLKPLFLHLRLIRDMSLVVS